MCKDHDLVRLYPEGVAALERLFRRELPCAELRLLDAVHAKATADWTANLARFRRLGTQVRYLLLAEALPRPQPKGVVHYFYSDFHGAWCGRIWSAFCPGKKRPTDLAAVLDQLASQGFLLVDTLPFAMKYTTRLREDKVYVDLLRASRGFLQGQLDDPAVPWAATPRVALAFDYPGRALITAYPEGITIERKPIRLTEDLIASDTSGLTNPDLLRKIFGMDEPPSPTGQTVTSAHLDFFMEMAERLKALGKTPDTIRQMMRDALRALDDHSFEHLYLRSMRLPIPNDILPGNIVHEEAGGDGTIHVRVRSPLPSLVGNGFAQYDGRECVVLQVDGNRYTLREIR